MSKNIQISKNILLTQKLLDYLQAVEYKKGYSFVVFSKNDKKLNSANRKLAEGLKKEGKKIIEAAETGNKNSPWHLTYA